MFPLANPTVQHTLPKPTQSNKFPTKFFAGVAATVLMVVLIVTNMYDVMPKNTLSACKKQFKETNRTEAGDSFCKCIHTYGNPLDTCLDEYEKAPDDIDDKR